MRSLHGIRVLDFSRVVAGPFCTMQLGDLGAEVIKIERPGTGDDSRAFGPPYQGGEAAYYLSINRNKKSVTLDLKHEMSKEVVWTLIEGCDVVVESFRPGVMDRLGFGYGAIYARKPEAIFCSISGFGGDGPDRRRPGYDLIVQGEAGIMDITGPKGGPPCKVGTSVADLVSGLYAAQGIVTALYERERSGRGRHIEVSMYDAVASLLTFNAGIYFATNESPTRRGNEHPTIVPYETFQAADGWLNIAVGNDAQWRVFCRAVGAHELEADPNFATAPGRVANRESLVPLINRLLLDKPRTHWLTLLQDEGVPCGAVATVAEVCDGPLLNERGRIVSMPHRTAGHVKAVASPLVGGESDSGAYKAPPLLGEHTDEVLGELVGLGTDQIDELRRRGAI